MSNLTIKEMTEDTTQEPNYPSLYFRTRETYVKDALDFAEKHGLPSLVASLESLQRVCNNCGDIAMIYEDFVKHSFYFVLYDKNTAERDFNGGIILHGYEETFSVELVPELKPHWSIHT